MIWVIVGALALVLIVLLVDWDALAKGRKLSVRPSMRPGKRAIPRSATRQAAQRSEEFDFDPEVLPSEEEEPMGAAEPPAPVEQPGYQPSEEVAAILSEADVHFRKGEVKAAEDLYLKAAAKDPRCSKAYSRLGVIYLEHGDNWSDAEEAFRQALKFDPENGFILNNLGLVLYHQDKYADAIRNFEAAVRFDEHNAARQANLGMGYMAIRQYAKAESSFKKALKLAPNELEYKDLLNESIEKKRAHKTMVRH